MGKIASAAENIVGGVTKTLGLSTSRTASADAVKATRSNEAAALANQMLYATSGGASGQELTTDQTKKKDTLLGN